MASQVEVCVVSYASGQHLAACLSAVEAVMGADTRVAVREHHLDAFAETTATLDRSPLATRAEHDPSNPGFGAGCNALAATSTADWLLFLNADATVLTWPLTTMPVPAVLGPLMVESGHPGRHYGLHYRVRDEIRRSWLRRYDPPPTGTGFVSGAALLIPRATFIQLGGFDTRYFMYYEDIDLCLRANAAGVPTHVVTEWTVRHSGGHTTSSNVDAALQRSMRSALAFHQAHSGSTIGYRLYASVDAALRACAHLLLRRRRTAASYLRLVRRVWTTKPMLPPDSTSVA
jgi:N-acetylglucosaminyl-diphospho-decaprenol L-rhamnosyltransferase